MNNTLKNMLYFFSAVVLVKFIGIFTTFFMARILNPSNYGLWLTLLLIASYSTIACFGTVETLIKQFPYYIGKGELENARKIENGVLGSIVLSAILVLIIGFTFTLLITNIQFQYELGQIRLMLITAVLSFFSAFFYYRFAAHQNFKVASFLDAVRAISSFVLLISFSLMWGLKGAIIGCFISELIICIISGILSNQMCGKVGLSFNLSLIWSLIKIGFPITIIWWVFTIHMTVDRIMSMSLLGKVATGYYGLGISIISTLILIPQVVGQVLYPKINEQVGKSVDQRNITLFVIIPTKALSLMLSLSIGILLLLSSTVYHAIFPKYAPGLASAQILLLGSFFICLIRNGVNFLVAINKQGELLIFFLVSIVVVVLGNFILIKLGFNIEGIAISTAFTGALLASLVWKSVFNNLGYSIINQIKNTLSLYMPFFLLIILIGIQKIFIPNLLNQIGMAPLFNVSLFTVLFSLSIFSLPPMSTWSKEIYHLMKTNIKARPQII
jgi:O-antigen/teichoic acid export membrane protein